MRVATIRNGTVAAVNILPDGYVIAEDRLSATIEILAPETDPDGQVTFIPLTQTFSDSQGGLLVQSDTAGIGQAWSEIGGFVVPPPSAADLKSYAGVARYAKEVGGTVVSGMPVATDRQSQAMIGNAFAAAKDDGTFTTKWKCADGSFVSLDNASILALGRAVRDHVNACFLKEADVVAAIGSGSITGTAGIDAAFASV